MRRMRTVWEGGGVWVGLALAASFVAAQPNDGSGFKRLRFKRPLAAKGVFLEENSKTGELYYERSVGGDPKADKISAVDLPQVTCKATFRLPERLAQNVQRTAIVGPGGLQSPALKSLAGETLIPAGEHRVRSFELGAQARIVLETRADGSRSGLRLREIFCYKWDFTSTSLKVTLADIEKVLGVEFPAEAKKAAAPSRTDPAATESAPSFAPASREAN